MTGYNHYIDCTCGWCVGGGGSSRSDTWNGPLWPRDRASVSSYTNPNATCPVCGASVFFYRSPFEGRVFFDEMGPPWPKHPCTDNPRIPIRLGSTGGTGSPVWRAGGWIPVNVARVERQGPWARLQLYQVQDFPCGFIVRIMPWRDGLVSGQPAHIKPLDRFGLARISLLLPMRDGLASVEDILAHRTLAKCAPEIVKNAQTGDPSSVRLVARATLDDWGTRNPATGKTEYPVFVDSNIAREWRNRTGES